MPPSVHDLVTRLGPDLVDAPAMPPGPDTRYAHVVVHDPLETPVFSDDYLVLAVGVSADSALALRMAAARPAALLLRHDGCVGQPLLDEALNADVALLVVPRSCSWSNLYTVAASLPPQVPLIGPTSVTGSEVISDLFAVANALAEAIRAPVTIEDNQSRLLAYSALHGDADAARAATILGHRVPDSFRQEVRRLGVAKRMLTETKPFFLASTVTGISSRTVVTLRANDEILGSIWAVTDTPLDADRTAALAEAAQSITLRLAHHRLTTDLQRQHQTATMALLLRGGASADEAGRRMRLEGTCFRLVAISATDETGETDDALLERCTTAMVQQLSLGQTAGVTACLAGMVYAVVACSADPDESLQTVRRMLLAARTSAQPSSHPVTMGMSGPVGALAELDDAREEADRVVHVLRERPSHDGCADVGEVGLAVSVLRLAELESARRSPRSSMLDRIDEYDTSHAASYGRTLRTYLESFGDPSIASEALSVHTNTLRYRLRRLHELFDVDLSDAETRFALMVEIRLHGAAVGRDGR